MASEYLPFLAMVLVQLGFAGLNIISKLALDSGMKPLVLVAYRQIFGALALLPFAYFFERLRLTPDNPDHDWKKTRPNITKGILFQIFLCSLFGATLNQTFYFVGLKNSTPTIGCALTNLLPAVTFILAVPFGLEKVEIRKKSTQAKLLGTFLCVGGAMLLSFYKGHVVGIGTSSIHWKYAEEMAKTNSSHHSNFLLGSFFLIASCVVWAFWFIIQARLSEKFNVPYTSSALMCFMASIECLIVGVFVEHNVEAWSLRSPIRLITACYSGLLCTALTFALMSWCIQKKGPLYVSVFTPLLLILVAIFSWALLRDKLYVGTVVGSVFIVVGLYAVMWGKNMEMEHRIIDINGEGHGEKIQEEYEKADLELQKS